MDSIVIDEVEVYDCEFYSPIQKILNPDGSLTVIEHACLKNHTVECGGKDCYYKKYHKLKWQETKHSNSQECIIQQLRLENDCLYEALNQINDFIYEAPVKIQDKFIDVVRELERKSK